MTKTGTLTNRQLQVLKLTKQGKSAIQISKTLGVSPNAVHQHLRRIKENGHDVSRPGTDPSPKPKPVLKVAANDVAAPVVTDVITPLEAIRARRKTILDELGKADHAVLEAREALDKAAAANDKLHEQFAPELNRLNSAEAALVPVAEKKKPAAKKPVLKEAPPAQAVAA